MFSKIKKKVKVHVITFKLCNTKFVDATVPPHRSERFQHGASFYTMSAKYFQARCLELLHQMKKIFIIFIILHYQAIRTMRKCLKFKFGGGFFSPMRKG